MEPRIVRRTLFPRRRRLLADKITRYAQPLGRRDIEVIQVSRFNAMWSYCLSEVPFYRAWRDEHRLPQAISHPSEIAQFPQLEKTILVARSDEIFQSGRITLAYTTGGSTGQPARYPRSAKDSAALYANTYVGRSWWGIQPFDHSVMLWGHSHLFGDGLQGRVSHLRRAAADKLVNIRLLNAYDLSEDALAADWALLRRTGPTYLLGYTSAIFKLARHIEHSGEEAAVPRTLRAVVVTAETVSEADIMTIEAVFRAPVVIEYGAAETGVMATSRGGTKPLQVMWDSFILLKNPDGTVCVTTLDIREFPLVQYAIGDVVVPGDMDHGNLLTLQTVSGRKQDMVQVRTTDAAVLDLSAILPVHILKTYGGILAVQFKQLCDGHLLIFVEADRAVDTHHAAQFFARELRKDHPAFDPSSVKIEQVAEPAKSISGKHALFVD